MKSKRVAQFLMAVAVAPALVIGGSGNAFADGNVSWKNKATGRCLLGLRGTGMNVITGSCDAPNADWRDVKQSDGTWQQRSKTMDSWCLDSNRDGDVYTRPCQSGNNNQKWYETKTSTGWQLKNKKTGRCLDSNARGEAYTLACNGGKHQRWA
ncbi:ricin-type beta-trefoil lectin domain protein [Streptomyces sp. NPDC001922]|uniref:RICIN domain-containing protein n=1 Tax=Streptomyces sp. NPDC001922 TaxID=3364624 RepID=UPI0036B69AFD